MATGRPRERLPSRAELEAAANRTVRDVIAPDLRVLFCGINPGLYTAYTGHHFARPGNRFWPTLHSAGFTDRVLHPSEERELLRMGLGVTNVVARASAMADELSAEELERGGKRLVAKVKRFRPRILAVLGVGAYRTALRKPAARVGPQQEGIGATAVWVLPNPSGLNANYQRDELTRLFRQLHDASLIVR